MYQQITLIGNLGADPEMRYTQSGQAVTTFRMAVSRTWVKDGQRQEKTVWFRVSAWAKLAELASQYLTKGSRVLVVGEVDEANAYLDREGKPRASLEVTANTIRFMSSRSEAAMHSGGAQSPGTDSGPSPDVHTDEDIPF